MLRLGLAGLLIAIGCSGCTTIGRTLPTPHEAGIPAPADRLLAFQEQIDGYAHMVVTRDKGFVGSGCYIGVVIAGKLAARLGPSETADFYVPADTTDMAAVPDPKGRGLCSAGWDPVPEHYTLKPEGMNLFRISLGAYRRPRLTPAIY